MIRVLYSRVVSGYCGRVLALQLARSCAASCHPLGPENWVGRPFATRALLRPPGAAESHLGCTNESVVVDPAREQPAGRSVHGHACDVPCPAQQPSVVVRVQRLDAQTLV